MGAILLLKQDQKADQEARRYFKRGADLDNKRAAYEYALLCRNGVGGKVNLPQALKYAEMAQSLGHDKAHSLIQAIKQELPSPE